MDSSPSTYQYQLDNAFYDQQIRLTTIIGIMPPPAFLHAAVHLRLRNMYGACSSAFLLPRVGRVSSGHMPAGDRTTSHCGGGCHRSGTGATDRTAKTATSAMQWKQRAGWLTDRVIRMKVD